MQSTQCIIVMYKTDHRYPCVLKASYYSVGKKIIVVEMDQVWFDLIYFFRNQREQLRDNPYPVVSVKNKIRPG